MSDYAIDRRGLFRLFGLGAAIAAGLAVSESAVVLDLYHLREGCAGEVGGDGCQCWAGCPPGYMINSLPFHRGAAPAL